MKHEWPLIIEPAIGPITKALINGRRALLEDGWCKGTATDGQGRHCAVGAFPGRGVGAVCMELRSVLPEGYYIVSVYNDLPTTTFSDIIALYDRAIASARSKGI